MFDNFLMSKLSNLSIYCIYSSIYDFLLSCFIAYCCNRFVRPRWLVDQPGKREQPTIYPNHLVAPHPAGTDEHRSPGSTQPP